MATETITRRTELMADTLRRFARRGSRSHLSNLLGKTRPEDVALAMRNLTPDHQILVFRVLVADYTESAGEVLKDVASPVRQRLVEELEPQEIASVLESMSVDDAVHVVESLPPDLEEKILAVVDIRDLDQVQTHLTYGDDTAGRLMDTSFFALGEETSVSEAIAFIQQSEELENIFYLYVMNRRGELVGVASLRQLLLSRPERKLSEVMTRSVIKVHTDTDQEEVARLAARYDLLAIPVVDEQERMVGIVTLDDIVDVMKEEATEDFFKMVGTSDDELVYQDRSFKVAGFRLPWLLVNLVGLLVAGMLIRYFEVTLKEALFLLFFLPVVMGMGGNIGSQTATIAVRGLATGRISLGAGRIRHFLWQQFKVGTILAMACAAITAGLSLVYRGGSPVFALVVGLSLLLAIVLASVNGAMIPVLFERLGIDPAVAAGPLVTTSNDITGILIYFGLASLLIDLWIH